MQSPSPSWPGIAVRRTASLPLAYVPAIHVLCLVERKQDVGHRDKRGDDGFCAEAGGLLPPTRYAASADSHSAKLAQEGAVLAPERIVNLPHHSEHLIGVYAAVKSVVHRHEGTDANHGNGKAFQHDEESPGSIGGFRITLMTRLSINVAKSALRCPQINLLSRHQA